MFIYTDTYITLEMAATIERLTGISSKFIVFVENANLVQNKLLKVKDFETSENLNEYVLFKKSGEDYSKLALWIAHCDKISEKLEGVLR